MSKSNLIFQIPQDGSTYIEEIITRCEDLINNQIWEGIHLSRFRRWINNFKTQEEKYFSACVLDSLIYRSDSQTVALMKQLFQRVLSDTTRLNNTHIGHIDDWEERLQMSRQEGDPLIRLVVAVKQTDPPTKSAYIIARYLKRHLRFSERWIIKPWEIQDHIKAGIRIFIFIDDFLGTGVQFNRLLKKENLEGILQNLYVVYAPLVAHTAGLEYLQKQYPALRVRSVETLDWSFCLFHPKSICFNDGLNDCEKAKSFYQTILETKEIRLSKPYISGFGELSLAYAFEHAAPNNSLPILWWQDSSSFTPLFDR